MSDPVLRERLRRYVRQLAKDDELAAFMRAINVAGEAYIFGGAARDVAFVGRKFVNDLDIIVSGNLDQEALSKFSGSIIRNNFGGYRLAVGHYDVDIWELQKSYAFRYDSSSFVTVARLLETVCFSTDAIAVSTRSGRVLKTHAFDASLRDRRLDFVVPPAKPEPVIAARIARLVLKLKLEMTPAVASYFVPCVEQFGAAAIIESEGRWKDRRMLNEIRVEQVRAELRLAISRAFEVARGGTSVHQPQRTLL